MALVKFGAGVSEMRGKEGGVIYSRNAYGSYIKAKVSPVNPQSQPQQTQRSLMGNLSQLWITLSGAEKAAWDNLGAQVTRINRFGDSTTYTGFSLFMRLNRNLSICGVTAIETAPTIPTVPALVIGAITATAGTPALSFAFTPTPMTASQAIVVYATNNIVTARRFVKNFYRLIFTGVSQVNSVDIYTEWLAFYSNALIEGANIFLRAKVIDTDTGFDSVPDVGSKVVAA